MQYFPQESLKFAILSLVVAETTAQKWIMLCSCFYTKRDDVAETPRYQLTLVKTYMNACSRSGSSLSMRNESTHYLKICGTTFIGFPWSSAINFCGQWNATLPSAPAKLAANDLSSF